MGGLIISPLRGLIDFWFALSYNLYIPSGLKKITEHKPRKDGIFAENEIISF